ncbi:acyl-CoA N-acyltransferase [Desarmillaria tabescens]|uniref:Acyl-CoA N-acyltransferase n=1 Tax=Armillaria tabescens TaxID=1929756 RepID=A0AA39N4U0_ARMTA|nr:acyl-CoA N-acyltransferase [Desarmillaria tabescens]KAK0457459.1 acyl-CoA N-acyltransferase [Desarmillaria tabescens]
MFTTKRLYLRAFRDSDLASLLNLWNDPLVQPMVTNEYVVPRGSRFTEYLRKAADSEKNVLWLMVEARDSGEFVGQTSLTVGNPKNRDGTFGIMFLPKFWGQGYGTEVTRFVVDYSFRELGLHRVSLSVFERNRNAIDLYKRVGFLEEGRKRKVNWVQGGWEDIFLMAILDEEWEAQGVTRI